MKIEEKWFLMDQILSEIALLVKSPHPGPNELLNIIEKILIHNTNFSIAFARISLWLKAQYAFMMEDVFGFVIAADEFYSEGKGYLRQAWKEITAELIILCKSSFPECISLLRQE